MRTAVLASGRGTNLQALLDAWERGELPVTFVGVGSDQPKAQALERARAKGIATRVFPREEYASRREQDQAILDWLTELGTELLLLAGYMRILGAEFIRQAKFPILNIHPSLLPAFPGLHAQRQALEYGVKVSGCTVHFVDEELDHGPIILQEAVKVRPDDTEESLSRRILEVEHRLYPKAVALVAQGKVRIQGRKVIIVD